MKNKVTTQKELIKRIMEKRKQFTFYGIKNIGLFGSFVRGEQTASSDIDILVEFTPLLKLL
jgi:predicted nucleotidyltransferase